MHNLASLQSMVAASKELCVEQNDVATGYRSWDAPGAIDVDLRLGDWDANADIPRMNQRVMQIIHSRRCHRHLTSPL